MKRLAYHILRLADGTSVSPAVVEVDDQGNVLGWHRLQGEEPFTEWVGGEKTIQ